MHRQNYVTTSYELTANVDLGDSWPLAILFYSVPQGLVRQDIMSLISDAMHSKDLCNGVRESALGCFGDTLHKDDNFVVADDLIEALLEIGLDGQVAVASSCGSREA